MDMNQDKDGAAVATRLQSLDALRGLDMLFLVGISGVLAALGKAYDNRVCNFLAGQIQHTHWHGFHLLDLVFPLFIFIAGTSMPFALGKRLEDGYSRAKLHMHVVRRSLLLFFLGLVQNGLLGFDFSNMHYTGVLQRIAVAYFFAALVVLNTSVRKQAAVAGSLLVGYWLLMTLVPVPGHGAGVITPEGNLHTYIDQRLLPGKFYKGECFDEDGLLQQMSSVAVCLAGALAGHWLRSRQTQQRKAYGLLAAGAACIVVGLVWDRSFPIIFRLWSSSYAMLTIGISSALLGVFYWVIDVKRYRRWAIPFVVVGLNAITIYLATLLIDFHKIIDFFVHGFISHLGSFRVVFFAICILAVKWLLLYFLYKNKIFLRV
jgi:predicted acyltransferase